MSWESEKLNLNFGKFNASLHTERNGQGTIMFVLETSSTIMPRRKIFANNMEQAAKFATTLLIEAIELKSKHLNDALVELKSLPSEEIPEGVIFR